MKDYKPEPVIADDVELGSELNTLSEAMAENVHATWAAERIAQGWRYGTERNDAAKEHPCLVPYDQLPEAEKTFDRKTAESTLKFILKAGFNIVPASSAPQQKSKQSKLQDILSARTLLTTILFAFCVLLWITGYCCPQGVMQNVLCGLALFAGSGIIILALYRYMRRTLINLILFLIFFAFGCGVYWQDGLFAGAFHALAEFFPSRGDYAEAPSAMAQIFFLMSYIFTASFLVAVFGRKLINRWWLLLAGANKRSKSVFWCVAPSTMERLLVQDILANSRKSKKFSVCNSVRQCIFSVRESAVGDTTQLLDDMNYKGCMVCFRKPGQLHKSCLDAPEHFFITKDHDWNIRKAREVWTALQKKKYHGKVDFYISVSDSGNMFWIESWAENIHRMNVHGNVNTTVEIHLINEQSIAARLLVKDHPVLHAPGLHINSDTCKVSGSVNILLLGFGDCGKAILRETICDSQFFHEDPSDTFSVTVIDRDENSFNRYREEHAEAVRDYNISFEKMDVQSGEFFRLLEENLHKWNRIIIALDNDGANMDIAALFIKISMIRGIPLSGSTGNRKWYKLFVRFAGEKPEDIALPQLDNCAFFGNKKSCYRRDVIVNEKLDRRAKAMDCIYRKGKANGDEWMQMPMQMRDSNRSAASGIRNLLLLGNMSEDDFSPECWAEFISKGNRLQTLAATEHLRWNAFHLMRGIRKWRKKDMTPEALAETNCKANGTSARWRHGAIVPYDDLQEIARILGKADDALQTHDIEIIKKTAQIMKEQNEY